MGLPSPMLVLLIRPPMFLAGQLRLYVWTVLLLIKGPCLSIIHPLAGEDVAPSLCLAYGERQLNILLYGQIQLKKNCKNKEKSNMPAIFLRKFKPNFLLLLLLFGFYLPCIDMGSSSSWAY